MAEFDFGPPDEVRESVNRARRPRLTYRRIGQLIGGTIGVFVGIAAAIVALGSYPGKVKALVVAFGYLVAGLFGGAAVGGYLASYLDRSAAGTGE